MTWHLNADSLHVGGALIQPKLKHNTQAMLPGQVPTQQLAQTGSNIAYCMAAHCYLCVRHQPTLSATESWVACRHWHSAE